MIRQNPLRNSGYFISGGTIPRPFGQMRRGAFEKGQNIKRPRLHSSLWISFGMILFSLGLSAYSIAAFGTLKNQVLTERMVVLERFDESEETLRRVGGILNFLMKDKDMSEVPANLGVAETAPLTVTTSARTSIKTSPQSKAETLMLIAKNSKLVVVRKEDDWLQVIAPTGERGWISELDLLAGEPVSG